MGRHGHYPSLPRSRGSGQRSSDRSRDWGCTTCVSSSTTRPWKLSRTLSTPVRSIFLFTRKVIKTFTFFWIKYWFRVFGPSRQKEWIKGMLRYLIYLIKENVNCHWCPTCFVKEFLFYICKSGITIPEKYKTKYDVEFILKSSKKNTRKNGILTC